MTGKTVFGASLFSELDIFLFKKGDHFKLYDKLGAHLMTHKRRRGVYFALWAPNADKVSVIGDFNNWQAGSHPLAVRWDGSGIYEGFIPGLKKGALYKFYVESANGRYATAKMDPFAFAAEVPPRTASSVSDLSYKWHDQKWMEVQKEKNALNAPLSIYELHLGSWKRNGSGFLSFKESAHHLVEYLKKTGFTHVELLPVMEHPFYGSWGYQILGYFSPTSRYGNPEDLMYLVDYLHQNDIGVIFDWTAAHFPNDEYGLAFFDGTHLYEHEDPRKGRHPDWNSCIFNYGRVEVAEFLISSVLFWLEKYHIDGIRNDAVASILYLDYSRKPGEWVPNIHGGRENLEGVAFLQKMNRAIGENFPNAVSIAEESTAWPMVTRPVDSGGLGFHYKWNMGWMHDTLRYFARDPIYRQYHHGELSFSMWYAYYENYILVLSHDEVVHGKGSLYAKMPQDEWQKYANLRLLMGYKYMHPGKKLLFMGNEIGQKAEWNHEGVLEWDFAKDSYQAGLCDWVSDLNWLYRKLPALHRHDYEYEGFEWIDFSDQKNTTLSYLRKAPSINQFVLAAGNFTPEYRNGYRIGVPVGGRWREVLNSDHAKYRGSGLLNQKITVAEKIPMHGRPFSLLLNLPPLGMAILQRIPE